MRSVLLILFLIVLPQLARSDVRHTSTRTHFMKITGYPHGRPGYVIDHINPLACGGADAIGNMQWQTIAEGKAKDKWERANCNPHKKATK